MPKRGWCGRCHPAWLPPSSAVLPCSGRTSQMSSVSSRKPARPSCCEAGKKERVGYNLADCTLSRSEFFGARLPRLRSPLLATRPVLSGTVLSRSALPFAVPFATASPHIFPLPPSPLACSLKILALVRNECSARMRSLRRGTSASEVMVALARAPRRAVLGPREEGEQSAGRLWRSRRLAGIARRCFDRSANGSDGAAR